MEYSYPLFRLRLKRMIAETNIKQEGFSTLLNMDCNEFEAKIKSGKLKSTKMFELLSQLSNFFNLDEIEIRLGIVLNIKDDLVIGYEFEDSQC